MRYNHSIFKCTELVQQETRNWPWLVPFSSLNADDQKSTAGKKASLNS